VQFILGAIGAEGKKFFQLFVKNSVPSCLPSNPLQRELLLGAKKWLI
jgi:hypothetical protein